MHANEIARRNHDELFPGHVSSLAVTDPELIETFDNFAFDEVLQHGKLDTRLRLKTQLAALIGCQAIPGYTHRCFLHAAFCGYGTSRHLDMGAMARRPLCVRAPQR